jgi:hypothetical protein
MSREPKSSNRETEPCGQKFDFSPKSTFDSEHKLTKANILGFDLEPPSLVSERGGVVLSGTSVHRFCFFL